MTASLESTTTGTTTTAAGTTTATGTTAAHATTSITLVATAGSLLVANVVLSGLLGIAQGSGVTARATFHHGLSKLAEDQLDGAHGVVVRWNDDVGERRITIGIQNADHRHVHALGFAHGVVFAARVDHDQSTGKAVQIAHAIEIAADALDLATNRRLVLLLVFADSTGCFQSLEFDEARQALTNGREVGQRSADPTLGNRRHLALLRLCFDHRSDLLLGAEEHDLGAGCSQRTHKVRCLVQPADRLLEIDDVDLMPFPVDEWLHLRVPTAGLVAVVDSGVDQFLRSYERHVRRGSLP